MLKLDLTLQEALSQLEDPKPFSTWELTIEDPFVIMIRQLMELTDEILKNNLATLYGGIKLIGQPSLIFKNTEEAVEAKNQHDKIEAKLTIFFEKHFGDLRRRLISTLALSAEAKSPPHHQHFINMVYEMLLNALEYGSGFCEMGSVLVDVRLAVNGVLCAIAQPHKGPDLKSLEQELLRDTVSTHLRLFQQSDKTGRGHGLLNATWKFCPLLGFEDLGQNGARAIILETRARVLKIDEEMRKEVERKNREYFEKRGRRP